MHENVITGAGCWGMKQVGRASSRGGGLISDCRSRFDGRVGGVFRWNGDETGGPAVHE